MSVVATGLDYSGRRLSGASVRAAGYTFVNRYLWFPGQRHAYLTADEYRDLATNGVEVHAIYEETTSDPAGGYAAGVRMAKQAVASAGAAGLPAGTTVYLCADAWLSAHGIPLATAMSFLDGARSVLQPAGYLTGAYGFADFVFGAHDGGHADRFWLCGAEIPDDHRPDWLHMYQWNNGRVYVPPPNGLECDLNKQYLPMSDRASGGGGGGGGDEMLSDERNAVISTWMAIFESGGAQGDQSIIDRLVEIQLNERANARRLDELLGRPPVDVDESDLATALAPLLRGLPDEKLDALSDLVSKKTNDERDRRERARLEVEA